MKTIEPITDSAALAQACAELTACRFIALDTEFIRERTYYPQLCLLQMAGGGGAAFCVDPLAGGMDLSPVLALLANPGILKVFHAGRQDMEIFFLMNGRVPAPVFDTQVAAQFAGLGESISYGDLIRRMLNHSLDKGARFTDWSHRPLTERQLAYALDDVLYLREAYTKLRQQLQDAGRLEWAEEEMQGLCEPSLYKCPPEDAWRRLKFNNLKPRQLHTLRALAEWREREAQRRNIPRGRIVKDDMLGEIAALAPQSVAELKHLRTAASIGGAAAEQIIQVVKAAAEAPAESWPHLEKRESMHMHADAVQMLQLLLNLECRRHGILPRLVASKDELEQMAAGNPGVRTLKDWRYELFGKAALKLLEGTLHIAYDPAQKEAVLHQ